MKNTKNPEEVTADKGADLTGDYFSCYVDGIIYLRTKEISHANQEGIKEDVASLLTKAEEEGEPVEKALEGSIYSFIDERVQAVGELSPSLKRVMAVRDLLLSFAISLGIVLLDVLLEKITGKNKTLVEGVLHFSWLEVAIWTALLWVVFPFYDKRRHTFTLGKKILVFIAMGIGILLGTLGLALLYGAVTGNSMEGTVSMGPGAFGILLGGTILSVVLLSRLLRREDGLEREKK